MSERKFISYRWVRTFDRGYLLYGYDADGNWYTPAEARLRGLDVYVPFVGEKECGMFAGDINYYAVPCIRGALKDPSVPDVPADILWSADAR